MNDLTLSTLAAASLALVPMTAAVSMGQAPAAATAPAADVTRHETAEQRDRRMAWWRAARYGMFIHWGVYSVPAGVWQGQDVGGLGEWIQRRAKIPVADYARFATQFDPTRFDADAWVALAKSAGMKYIVITAKHHDGFAMFDSKASPFNIVDATPFKRDPLKALAAACAKQDMRLGVYYSQNQDWHHPGGGVMKGEHWDKDQDGDFDRYVQNVALPQVDELLKNYGPLSVIWFDTPDKTVTPEIAARFVRLIERRQPQVVVNNRLGGGFVGDTKTPEQHIPAQGFPGQDWETCMTINDTWGFKSSDTQFKSTQTLLRNLIDIASKGGNYLLNVGPDATGVIPQPEVDRLRDIGKWLDVNGEAIYGTGATPFGAEAGAFSETEKDKDGKPRFLPSWKWRCTTAPGKLYLHLLEWPASGRFTLDGLKASAAKAYFLADPGHTPLTFAQAGQTLDLTLPAAAPDPIASVVCIELRSP